VPLRAHDPSCLCLFGAARHPVFEPGSQRGAGHSEAVAGVVRDHHGQEAPRCKALPNGGPQIPGPSAVVPADQVPLQVRAAAHLNRLVRELQGQCRAKEAVEKALVHCHHGLVRQVPQALGHLYEVGETGKSRASQPDFDADQAPGNLHVLGGLAQVREAVRGREAHDEARFERPLLPHLGAHDPVLERPEANRLVGGAPAAAVAGGAREEAGGDSIMAHGTAEVDEPGQGVYCHIFVHTSILHRMYSPLFSHVYR